MANQSIASKRAQAYLNPLLLAIAGVALGALAGAAVAYAVRRDEDNFINGYNEGHNDGHALGYREGSIVGFHEGAGIPIPW